MKRICYLFCFLANAPDSDRKDLLSELEVMKKLKRHPHVIKLMGCVTDSGKGNLMRHCYCGKLVHPRTCQTCEIKCKWQKLDLNQQVKKKEQFDVGTLNGSLWSGAQALCFNVTILIFYTS